ncbi:MAG: hypothetical protein RL748_4364, partial [Pseudomonadota bacterium]
MSEQESGLEQAETIRQPIPVAPAAAAAGAPWERGVLEKLLTAQIKEQRATRRWSIFFRVMTLLVVLLFLILSFGHGDKHASGPHTAVVEVNGVIDGSTVASAQNVNAALNRAFAAETSVGVILRINSPGGSPVQSSMINDEIGRLR